MHIEGIASKSNLYVVTMVTMVTHSYKGAFNWYNIQGDVAQCTCS